MAHPRRHPGRRTGRARRRATCARSSASSDQNRQLTSAGAGLSTSARIGSYATEFVGYQDNQRAAFQDRATYQGSITDTLSTQRTNLEGVNIDDEMQKDADVRAVTTPRPR